MQTVIPTVISTAWFSARQLLLSKCRAQWDIKQAQANQIEAACRTLADTKLADDIAMDVAEQILSANIGI